MAQFNTAEQYWLNRSRAILVRIDRYFSRNGESLSNGWRSIIQRSSGMCQALNDWLDSTQGKEFPSDVQGLIESPRQSKDGLIALLQTTSDQQGSEVGVSGSRSHAEKSSSQVVLLIHGIRT